MPYNGNPSPEGRQRHSTATTVAYQIYIRTPLWHTLRESYDAARKADPKLNFSRYICRVIEKGLRQ